MTIDEQKAISAKILAVLPDTVEDAMTTLSLAIAAVAAGAVLAGRYSEMGMLTALDDCHRFAKETSMAVTTTLAPPSSARPH